jgi:ATP-dependent Clp protease ATP-binding subunit ClpA
VLQLEAQLADRQVTIELSPEAKDWLAEKGYDEQMGARPLARVIQEHIKKPLAEEVLFGRLKNGGHVRVIVEKDEEGFPILGFDYPAGPVTPKAEPVAPDVRRIAKRAAAKKSGTAKAKRKPKGSGGGSGGVPVPTEPKRPSGSVPKVPLKAE